MPGPASATAGTDATSVSVQTAHDDMIHDCQLDFYGKRLATCSSDRTVKIFDVVGGSAAGNSGYTLVDTLRGHEGPVWEVAWAHPKFGAILASCSYDGKVFVWREGEGGAPSTGYGSQQSHSSWSKIKEHMLHTASVNSLSWAPHELGPILACASSDGKVSVLTFNNDGTWDASLFSAHQIGCNAVSWAPGTVPGSLIQPQGPGQQGQAQISTVKRFASGGCDGLVKIWNWRDDTKTWECDEALEGHADWVRDVAWAPNIGLPRSYLASAGQDKTVIVWTQDTPGAGWSGVVLDPTTATSIPLGSGTGGKFPDVVWRVSWSVTGNVLAVSGGDGRVSLWKENLKGKWECVSDLRA